MTGSMALRRPKSLRALRLAYSEALGDGWAFRQNYSCVSHALAATKATITACSARSFAHESCHLRQNCFQGITVILVAGEILYADNDTAGFGHGDGGLGTEFVFFVLFAFGDTAHLGFMKAVNFVFVLAFLVDGLSAQSEFTLPGQAGSSRKFTFHITQQCIGHRLDPANGNPPKKK